MKKIKVYIASPYTKGDKVLNVNKSFEAYDKLLKLGFIPFAPLTSHYIDLIYPQTYETWLEIDFEWITSCHCLFRLPGESYGADQEIEYAKKFDMPIFYNYEDLIKWRDSL